MGAGCGTLKRSGCQVVPIRRSSDVGPETSEPSVHKSKEGRLEARLREVESLVTKQADHIQSLEKALASVQRDCRRTVSVLQYNILASYLGRNTQPWFLYGSDISPEDRKRVLERYMERDFLTGKQRYTWPAYAEGILSPDAIERVERRDEDFRWELRQRRLLDEIRRLDADVVSLVELDHHPHFAQCMGDTWDSVFHKRPRAASHDGCGVFWRRSKFVLEAQQTMDLVDDRDSRGGEKRDRSCLIVLLKWRACRTSLVVISTHLAKDPDNRGQTAIRVRQVTQIMQGLTEFTEMYGASDAPVILMGDLNARHFAEIRGLARTVWQINGSPIHKFLWSASDVPTGPTSVTEARQCRIDVVQFLSSQLEVVEVAPVPKLPPGEVIPNAQHPSDHFPVYARFRLKDDYQKHRECARAWLECVAGREKLHPLTEAELNIAFEFFDRDRSSRIHKNDLEEACLDLQCSFHVDVQRLLLDCFRDQQISYTEFIQAYEVRLNHERMRCVGELEHAFNFIANDSTHIHLAKLEAAFREITPISFSDDEVKEMIKRLGMHEGQQLVDLHSFCEVVCRATFPHKKHRSNCGMGGALVHRESTAGGADKQELALRLDRLNSNLGWSFGPFSPVRDHSGPPGYCPSNVGEDRSPASFFNSVKEDPFSPCSLLAVPNPQENMQTARSVN